MWLLTREDPDTDSAPLLFDSAETLALYLENGKSELYNVQWIPVYTSAQTNPKEEKPEIRMKVEQFFYPRPLSGESE
jgi:hypothetical protein